MKPTESKDANGSVVLASVQTVSQQARAEFNLKFVLAQYGDTIHTFVQRNDYKGPFLPGFIAVTKKDPLSSLLCATFALSLG